MFTIGEKCTLFNLLLNSKEPVKLELNGRWMNYFCILKNWTKDDILTFQGVNCSFTFNTRLKDITNAKW